MSIVDPWATGVAHLDQLLGGGLPSGTVTLIVGVPGSGKTTLASQMVFAQARSGKRAIILSALSESTSSLIKHLSTYRFYEPRLVGDHIQILSLRQTLAAGLNGAKVEVIDSARRLQANIVMIDGIHGLQNVAANTSELRQFFYDVSTTLATLGMTTIVTSESQPHGQDVFSEATTADIVIGLHFALHGVRHMRGLEIIKTRGAESLPGLHALTINADGVSVYPQLEERVTAALLGGDAQTQGAERTETDPSEESLPAKPDFTDGRAAFGLPELDRILGGGVPTATSTVLAGSIGIGKTLLAIAFALAGVRAGEPVVFLSFRETRNQLLRAAEPFTMGPELHDALASGTLTHIATPAIKINPDIIADRLLETLDRTHARRLVIDSIAELEEAILASAAPERLREYLTAFITALHQRNITVLMTKETSKAVAPSIDFSADPLAVLAENVILAQQVSNHYSLERVVSVLKLRYGTYDPYLHDFHIHSPEGPQVGKRRDGRNSNDVALSGKNQNEGEDRGAPHG